MTFQEFVAKMNGNYTTEFPYTYNKKTTYQCVGLDRQYIQDVLGFPQSSMPPAATAVLIFKNFPAQGNQYFEKVVAPFGDPRIPPPGAIMFWGLCLWPGVMTGTAGHTDIVGLNVSEYQFIGFDQNWGNPNFCRYVNHNYHGTLGWLIPKSQ
jgi:hypothetical protein